ncbi:class A sortase [Streptococcaceae bacterium ESL0687]|nr:class A sortase [Streptococcaceae bacterium ESL0687]
MTQLSNLEIISASYNKQYSLLQMGFVFLVSFLLSFLFYFLFLKIRRRPSSYKKIGLTSILLGLIFASLVLGVQTLYQKNTFAIQNKVLNFINYYKQKDENKRADLDNTSRQDIEKMVMRQAVRGLDKQGFVSIPSRSILLPIYNDAYSDTGLNAGAAYANKSQGDPLGTTIPRMGQGNYGLAAHNFNDGKTGFSSLQKEINNDSPYISNGKLSGSNWLNGQTVLLANASGIYEYQITGQTLVTKDTTSVLNPSENPELTIVSCLFPSTDYRIITHALLKNTYTWEEAPQKFVNEFNLKVKSTNAHVSWWNPGTEEGANGDKGGSS